MSVPHASRIPLDRTASAPAPNGAVVVEDA